ncbi:MAG: OmpA family protein [Acidobacteria bacterium]|nr:OmpA family protein [Acidobacteriota bacterium]
MRRFGSEVKKIAVVGALSAGMVLLTAGCSTKNYVRSQTAPLITQTNDLEARSANDHRAIADLDDRATHGINDAQGAADRANARAMAAGQSADTANTNAQEAYNRVDTLSGVVAGLDKYKPVADVSVTFGFDKSVLTASDKQQLDDLASGINSRKHYILEVTGGTDSTGDKQYNYALSQRRADAVVTYLAQKYNIAPHKFYLVGIGEDNAVASNKTAAGRKENRRVQVRVLSNMEKENATTASSSPAGN